MNKHPVGIIFIALTLWILQLSSSCKSAEAADLQRSPILFHHESSSARQLKTLIKEFNFDEFVSKGKTEFERMILLKEWVFSRISYRLNFREQNLRNALKILRRSKKGESFLCTNFCTVYMQCALSLGWTSRYFFLRMPTGEQHTGNDIWSNQYRKWVYIDPTWNIHIEKNNIPLSIIEIRKEWLKNNGRDIKYVFGAGSSKKRYASDQLPIKRRDSNIWERQPVNEKWISYTYEIAMPGRNDFFSQGSGNGSDIWSHIYIIKDKINRGDKRWPFRNRKNISDMKRLFHDLNRVDINTSGKGITSPKGAVKVVLNAFGVYNYTPNFKEFLIKIDNNNWKAIKERFFFGSLSAGEIF